MSGDFERKILQSYYTMTKKMSHTFSEQTKSMLHGEENIMHTFPDKNLLVRLRARVNNTSLYQITQPTSRKSIMVHPLEFLNYMKAK